MQEPLAFLDGRWVAASAAAVSVSDVGFILGAAVAEQLRTFAGRIFHLDDHLARLAQSLEIVGIEARMTRENLRKRPASWWPGIMPCWPPATIWRCRSSLRPATIRAVIGCPPMSRLSLRERGGK